MITKSTKPNLHASNPPAHTTTFLLSFAQEQPYEPQPKNTNIIREEQFKCTTITSLASKILNQRLSVVTQTPLHTTYKLLALLIHHSTRPNTHRTRHAQRHHNTPTSNIIKETIGASETFAKPIQTHQTLSTALYHSIKIKLYSNPCTTKNESEAGIKGTIIACPNNHQSAEHKSLRLFSITQSSQLLLSNFLSQMHFAQMKPYTVKISLLKSSNL